MDEKTGSRIVGLGCTLVTLFSVIMTCLFVWGCVELVLWIGRH